MIHIVIIATNKYFPLGVRFIKNFYKYSDVAPKFHFFSDTNPKDYIQEEIDVVYYHETHTSWQAATNSKFHNILKVQASNKDFVYYFDADTNVDKYFFVEWFLGDSVGGEHFGNKGFLSGNTGYDRNENSKAYVPEDSELNSVYYFGAFFGGRADFVKHFCEILIDWQKKDKLISYEPAVNDESYINKFFHYSPPVKVVPYEDFPFIVSDKGGINETRRVDEKINKLLQDLKLYKDEDINIRNGKVELQIN